MTTDQTPGQAAAPGQAHKVRAALSEAVGHAMQSANTCKAEGPCEGCESNHEAAMNLADAYARAAIAAAAPAPAGEGVLLSDYLRQRGRPEVASMIEQAEHAEVSAYAQVAFDAFWASPALGEERPSPLGRESPGIRNAWERAVGAVLKDAFPGLRRQLDEARGQLDLARAETATIAAAAANTARELAEARELLGEIGVMAANAPEDGDSFGLLEQIAMRIAAMDVEDDGRHPDGCTCQFCREDEREERARLDREELDDDIDNTIPDTEGGAW